MLIKINLIHFIILISSKKSNIFIHLLDCLGTELFFYSIGSIGLRKKTTKELVIFQNFIKKIFLNFNILFNKPLAIHILNLNYNLNWILKQLVEKLMLITTKLFICFAYNGCRKKKLKIKSLVN